MNSQENTLTQLVQEAVKTLTIRMAPADHHPSQKCTHDNRVMTWTNIVQMVIEDHNGKCNKNQWCVGEINLIVTAKIPDSSYVAIPVDYQIPGDGKQKTSGSKSASGSQIAESDTGTEGYLSSGKPDEKLRDTDENFERKKREITDEIKPDLNQYSGKTTNTDSSKLKNEAKSNSILESHIEPVVKNGIATLNIDSHNYPCQKCDKVRVTLSGLKAHSQIHQEPGALFKCPICPMVCKKQHMLDKHMSAHSNKKDCKCEDCAKTFEDSADLKAHTQKEHGINVGPKCHACGALFKDTNILKNHLWQNHQIGDGDSYTSDDEENTNMVCCPHCNEKFGSEDNLKGHVEIHGPLNRYRCDICGWRFVHTKLLQQHLEKHDANKQTLICQFCEEKYDKAVDLNDHLKTHSDKEVVDPKQCKVCKKTFSKVSTKKKHELRHFQLPEKYDCPRCDKSFPYAFYLRRHMEAHEKTNKCSICGELFRFEVELIRHRRDVHQLTGNFVCDVCGKSYTTKSHLNDHMNTHTGKRVYLCDICGKTFLHRAVHVSHMKQHRDVANRGTVPCTYCPRRFQSQKRLKAHVRNIHLQDKRHACHYCEKKYATSFALKAHEQTHTGDYEFKCPYCPKQFPSKKQFIHHERTHTGERPHECSICKKKFTQKSVCNRHMRDVHHDKMSDKPRERFTCSTCGATLGSKLTLQQHEKRHIGVKDYTCDTCGAGFMFNCDLIRHLRIHTNGKPYRCDQCPMSFAKRADLSRHCMVHGNQVQQGANSLMDEVNTVIFHLQ